MAGILESLAGGLRAAGGILSPGVYERQKEEEARSQGLIEQRSALMAQQIIRAAEAGSIPPERAQAALANLGMNVPVGPNAATQQRQEEIQRRQAISKGFQGLAPEDRTNPLKMAQVFIENGDHERGAQYINAAETRQARQEALVANLEQRAEEARLRSEDRAADRASREQAAREANALRAQIAQGQQALQRDSLELRRLVGSQSSGGGKPPAGYRFKPDGSLEPIPGGPATKEGSKMPAELQRMTIGLNALETGLTAYEEALKDFNPRSTDQANMTKRAAISSLVADLRMQAKEAQALGALTGPDVAILDKALAEPASMKGAMYGRGGLTAQVAETRAAIARRREGLASLNAAKQTTDAPKKVTSDADYNALPAGAQYIAPDGSLRRKK